MPYTKVRVHVDLIHGSLIHTARLDVTVPTFRRLTLASCRCVDQVRAYSKVFWKRVHELADQEKIIKTIERGEQRIQRQHDIMNAIATKLENYKNPMVEMKIQVRLLFLFHFRLHPCQAVCVCVCVCVCVRLRQRQTAAVLPIAALCLVPSDLCRHSMAPTRARPTPRRRTASSFALYTSLAMARGTTSKRRSTAPGGSASTGSSRAGPHR